MPPAWQSESDRVKVTEWEPTFVMDVNTFSSTALGWALCAMPGWMWRLWAQGLAIHLSQTSRRASSEQVSTQVKCVARIKVRETLSSTFRSSFLHLWLCLLSLHQLRSTTVYYIWKQLWFISKDSVGLCKYLQVSCGACVCACVCVKTWFACCV